MHNYKNINKNKKLFLFSKLISNFKDDEIIFHIKKSTDKTISLNKKEVKKLCFSLSERIVSNTTNQKIEDQLKIFALCKASKESSITMLSSALLGAHHCICFEELSVEAISLRLEIFKPDIILYRKGLEDKIFSASKKAGFNKKIIEISFDLDKQYSFADITKKIKSMENSYEEKSSLFTLFTSGSTGKPKGIIHSAKKYINYAKFSTKYFFGLDKSSKIFTATDAGWINGHTYAIYGPLSLGSESIICENLKFLSKPNNLINTINETKATCFYSSVTLLRLLKSKSKVATTNKFDIALDRIGSCGEPLAHEVGEWAMKFFKPIRKTIVNTYFQTETGGILVAPRDEDGIPNDYSSVGIPRKELGIDLAKNIFNSVDLENYKIQPNEIIIKNKWDGLYKDVVSDRKVNYWINNSYFRLNDTGFFDEKGFLYISGRSDDVINCAGHRISSSEIESICMKIPDVTEACCVPRKNKVLGDVPVLFISTKSKNNKNTYEKIRDLTNKYLSDLHQPEEITIFQSLPKTRSGKIMRRIMKDLSQNYFIDYQKDYSTLANYSEFYECSNKYIESRIDKVSENSLIFNLESFCKRVGLNLGNKYTLNTLIITIAELIFRTSQSSIINNLSIKLISKNKEYLTSNIEFNKKQSLLNINKAIQNTEIRKESCLLNIEKMIFKFKLNKNDNYIFLFKKIKLKENEFFIQDFLSTDQIKESPKLNNIIKNLIDIKESNKNSIPSLNQSRISLFRCFKCNVSVEEIAKERGINKEELFLISIKKFDGTNALICDTCLQGW